MLNIIKGILTALGVAMPYIDKILPVIEADLAAGKTVWQIVVDVLSAYHQTTPNTARFVAAAKS